ncbi:MAG TPA: YkgJ family cysteine cluster protein [Bdellovibrionota bacterium]
MDLSQYRELCARLDSKFSEIHGRYSSQFACRNGCHSCCKPGIKVNRLEKEALKQFLLSHPSVRNEIEATERENPHGGKRCNFLSVSGACLVYEARPLVCRSHGAPLQMRPLEVEDENTRVRDVCPLNFKELDIAKLPAEAVLNMDTVYTLLALLLKRTFPGDENRTKLELSEITGA